VKDFIRVEFSPQRCREELAAYRALLDSKPDLEERADIKPFFEAHPHLSAFLGSYTWSLAHFELIAFQYQLFGDFSCDLVVGDAIRNIFTFVEWEDGSTSSLFRQQGKKATPEWGTSVERGFSQVLDWFWKLDDMARTDDFEARFGARNIRYSGLLVVGRDSALGQARERRRWEWRWQKVLVNSLPVQCVTYDQLHRDLSAHLEKFYRPPPNLP
jgi:hypothetical protein